MVSNLSTIGLAFGDDADFTAAMTRLSDRAEGRRPTPAGHYAIWHSTTGAELWFHAKADGNEIVGLTPFFEGKSRVSLKVTERVTRPGDSAFEGAFLAWMAPGEDRAGVYPLVFDAIDFAAIAGRTLPALWRARLTGFAHQVRAFPSAEDYDGAQTAEPKFGPQSFIPLGMFATAAAESETPPPPSSTALLVGRVAEHRLLSNEETGQSFHWLFVESLEAAFDIVADPEIVEGDIVKGGTVEVSCWLFGRILD